MLQICKFVPGKIIHRKVEGREGREGTPVDVYNLK